jgi:hypothetical protein
VFQSICKIFRTTSMNSSRWKISSLFPIHSTQILEPIIPLFVWHSWRFVPQLDDLLRLGWIREKGKSRRSGLTEVSASVGFDPATDWWRSSPPPPPVGDIFHKSERQFDRRCVHNKAAHGDTKINCGLRTLTLRVRAADDFLFTGSHEPHHQPTAAPGRGPNPRAQNYPFIIRHHQESASRALSCRIWCTYIHIVRVRNKYSLEIIHGNANF